MLGSAVSAKTISRPGAAPLRRPGAGLDTKSRKRAHAKLEWAPARSNRAALRPEHNRDGGAKRYRELKTRDKPPKAG
jgi:hypothetical protein